MAQFINMFFVFVCLSNFYKVSGIGPGHQQLKRAKRHVGEDSVQSVLQSFISRLDAMQRLIKQQDKILMGQKKEIKDLKWYLKRKGTQERLEEIQRDVDHQTLLLERAVDIKALPKFKESVAKFEKRTKGLSTAVKERKTVIDDIFSRVLLPDDKIECRNTFTSWHKQADYKIGALDKHDIECGQNEFLQRFLLERKDGSLDSVVRFKYRCCRYNVKEKWSSSLKKSNQK